MDEIETLRAELEVRREQLKILSQCLLRISAGDIESQAVKIAATASLASADRAYVDLVNLKLAGQASTVLEK